MPRDLFGDVTDPRVRVGSQKWSTLPVSLAAHAAVLALLLIVPLTATGVLPSPHVSAILIVEPPAPAPPPPPLARPPRAPDTSPPANPEAAPIEAPTTITPEPLPVDPGGVDDTSNLGGLINGSVVSGDLEPPVVASPAAAAPTTVRIGGDILPPTKVRDAAPVYPSIAQSARVEGMVILQATIDEQGRVVEVRVLRGVPLLNEAALAAVRQWEYTPTLLNGIPVAVIMTVTVDFRLR